MSAPPFALLICLQAFLCCNIIYCGAFPQFQSGSDDTTVVVGDPLALTCTFSEPFEENQFVFWKREKAVIGVCQGGSICYKVGYPWASDSRTNLYSQKRQWFMLMISNVTISDAGSYECGLSGNDNYYQTANLMGVSVVPLQVVSGRQLESTPKTSQLTITYFPTPSQSTATSPPKGSKLATKLSPKTSPLTVTGKSSLTTFPSTTRSSALGSTLTTRVSSKIPPLRTNSSALKSQSASESSFKRTAQTITLFPKGLSQTAKFSSKISFLLTNGRQTLSTQHVTQYDSNILQEKKDSNLDYSLQGKAKHRRVRMALSLPIK